MKAQEEQPALFDATDYTQPAPRARLLPGGFMEIPGELFQIGGRPPQTEDEVVRLIAALLPSAERVRRR